MFLVKIFITPIPTVNDPQGQTILGSLRQLGFSTVGSVRVGKFITVRLDEDREETAELKVKEMCEMLLANSVIEDYRFELERVNSA